MTTFSRKTSLFQRAFCDQTPCALRLYDWLLERFPAGRTQEMELEDFVEFSGYSLRHSRDSLKALIAEGFVEQIRRFSGDVYKLITHDDRTISKSILRKISEKYGLISEKCGSISETEGSKSHSVVTKNKEIFRENRDTVPLHPVNQEVEPGNNLVTPDIPEGKAVPEPVSRNFRQELENTLQQPLNKNILAVLLKYSESRARDALDALKEMLATGKVKNPAGFFVIAMRKGFKPNHARSSKPQGVVEPETVQSDVPDGFLLWLEWALKAGVAIASGHNEKGELMVYGKDSAEPYEQACQTWPLETLQKLVAQPEVSQLPEQKTKPLPAAPEPAVVDDPVRRQSALARLQMKFSMPLWKESAIAEAKLWGFDVTGTGIFEVAF